MKNLSISKKLIVGFGLVIIMLVITIGMAFYSINGINREVENYSQYTLPNSVSVWTIRRNVVSIQRYLAEGLSETNDTRRNTLFDLAQLDSTALLDEFEKYANNQRDDSRDANIAKLSEYFAEAGVFRREMVSTMADISETSFEKAKQIFSDQYVPTMDKTAEILVQFTETADARATVQAEEAKGAVRLAMIILAICGAVAVVLAVIMSLVIRKSILTPVEEIVKVYKEIAKGNKQIHLTYEAKDEMGQMAALIRETNDKEGILVQDVIDKFTQISQGDLRVRVDLEYPGDYNLLKQAIESTVSELNDTMYNINTAAEQVSIGSSQVSDGAQALAAGSTEQASSVEELNATVVQIAEQAELNLENVKTAGNEVGEAGASMNVGNEHMGQLSQAMDEISTSSNQIANITKVIEDIAFQTNILALNAAIEAARAGNAGKGFAVVADEVRNLAAKSGEAARQTAELIHDSVITVERGTRITADTAEVLLKVGDGAKKVQETMAKINQATREQSDAIEMIKQGLGQVSSVVQTNAATAEENSATSEEMSAQAVALREEVGRFKLNTGSRKHVPVEISLLGEPEKKEEDIAVENVESLEFESPAGKY